MFPSLITKEDSNREFHHQRNTTTAAPPPPPYTSTVNVVVARNNNNNNFKPCRPTAAYNIAAACASPSSPQHVPTTQQLVKQLFHSNNGNTRDDSREEEGVCTPSPPLHSSSSMLMNRGEDMTASSGGDRDGGGSALLIRHMPEPPKTAPASSSSSSSLRPKPLGRIDTGRGTYATDHTSATATVPHIRHPTMPSSSLSSSKAAAPPMSSSSSLRKVSGGGIINSARATSTLLRQLNAIKFESSGDSEIDNGSVYTKLGSFEEELRSIISCNEVRQRNLIYRLKLVMVRDKEERELLEAEHLFGRDAIMVHEEAVWSTGRREHQEEEENNDHDDSRNIQKNSLTVCRFILEEHSARSQIINDSRQDTTLEYAFSAIQSLNTLHSHNKAYLSLQDRCTVEWRELHQRAELERVYWLMHCLTQVKCTSWLRSSEYLYMKQQQQARGHVEDLEEEQGRHRFVQREAAERELITAEMYQRRRWLAGLDVVGDEVRLRGRMELEEERLYGILLAEAEESWDHRRRQTEISRNVVQREQVLRWQIEEAEQKEWTHVATWAHRRWYNIYTAARELVEGPKERQIMYEVEVTDSDADEEESNNGKEETNRNRGGVDGGDITSTVDILSNGGREIIIAAAARRYPLLNMLVEVGKERTTTTTVNTTASVPPAVPSLQACMAFGLTHYDFFAHEPTPGSTPFQNRPRHSTPSSSTSLTNTTTAMVVATTLEEEKPKKKRTKTVVKVVQGSMSFTQQQEAFGRRDIIEFCWKNMDAIRSEMYRQRGPLLARSRERVSIVETYIDGRIALMQQEDAQWRRYVLYTWSHNKFNVSRRDATRTVLLEEMSSRSQIVQEKDTSKSALQYYSHTIACLHEETIERAILVAKEIRVFRLNLSDESSTTSTTTSSSASSPSFFLASLRDFTREEMITREEITGVESDHWVLFLAHVRSVVEGGSTNLEVKYVRDLELVTRKEHLITEHIRRISTILLPQTEIHEEHFRSLISLQGETSMISAMYMHATNQLETAHRHHIDQIRERSAWLTLTLLEAEEEEAICREERIISLEMDVRATMFLFAQRCQPLFVFEGRLLSIEREEANHRMMLESQAELGAHATLRVAREDIYPNTLGRVMNPNTGHNHLLDLQTSRAVSYITPRNVDEEHRGTLENRAREYVGKSTKTVEREKNGGALWRKAPPIVPTTFGMWLLHAFDEIHEDETYERTTILSTTEHTERSAIWTMMREAEDRRSILALQEQLWTATSELWTRIATREIAEFVAQHERVVRRCEEDDRAYIWLEAREATFELLSHREEYYLQLEADHRERLLVEQGPLMREFYTSRFEIASEEHRSINGLFDTFRWGTFVNLRRNELEKRLIRRDCCTSYYHFQGEDIDHPQQKQQQHSDYDETGAAFDNFLPDEVLIAEMVEAELQLPAPPTVIKSLLPTLWTREELITRFKSAHQQQQRRKTQEAEKLQISQEEADKTATVSNHYVNHSKASYGGREIATITSTRDEYMRTVIEGSGTLFTAFHSELIHGLEPKEDEERRRLMGMYQYQLGVAMEKDMRRWELEKLQQELEDLEEGGGGSQNNSGQDTHQGRDVERSSSSSCQGSVMRQSEKVEGEGQLMRREGEEGGSLRQQGEGEHLLGTSPNDDVVVHEDENKKGTSSSPSSTTRDVQHIQQTPQNQRDEITSSSDETPLTHHHHAVEAKEDYQPRSTDDHGAASPSNSHDDYGQCSVVDVAEAAETTTTSTTSIFANLSSSPTQPPLHLVALPPCYAYLSSIKIPITALQTAADVIADTHFSTTTTTPEENIAEFSVRLSVRNIQSRSAVLPLGYAPTTERMEGEEEEETVLLCPEYTNNSSHRWSDIQAAMGQHLRRVSDEGQRRLVEEQSALVRSYFVDLQHCDRWIANNNDNGDVAVMTHKEGKTSASYCGWSIPINSTSQEEEEAEVVEIVVVVSLSNTITGEVLTQADIMKGTISVNSSTSSSSSHHLQTSSPPPPPPSTLIEVQLTPLPMLQSQLPTSSSPSSSSSDCATATLEIRRKESNWNDAVEAALLAVYSNPVVAIESLHESQDKWRMAVVAGDDGCSDVIKEKSPQRRLTQPSACTFTPSPKRQAKQQKKVEIEEEEAVRNDEVVDEEEEEL